MNLFTKTIFLYCFLVWISCFSARAVAQDLQGSFAKANAFYAEGKYELAITSYSQILKSNQVSEDLYYNLGNCYYKTNQFAKAILYYEKALKTNPSNEDAVFNLHLAQSKTVDKINPLPELFYKRWWHQWLTLASFDGWAQLAIASLVLLVLSLILFMRTLSQAGKVIFFSLTTIFFVMFAITFGSSWYGYRKYVNQSFGIVVAPSTYVKSSPSAQGLDVFILHEGTKGQITEQIGDWRRIRMADGNEGWLKREAIEII